MRKLIIKKYSKIELKVISNQAICFNEQLVKATEYFFMSQSYINIIHAINMGVKFCYNL
jgi:hypothetical protein